MRRYLIFGLCGVALAVSAWMAIRLVNRMVPYGLEHFREIYSIQLASMINAWQKSGGNCEDLTGLQATNSSLRTFPFRTNISHNGITYHAVVALEANSFRRNGFLVGTTNLDVLWLDSKGGVDLELRKGVRGQH
jgi:hypothetical protein